MLTCACLITDISKRNNYILFMELQELGTDVNLYALVFGESVLNDAVCIILFLLKPGCFNFFSTDTYILLGTHLWSDN